MGCQALAKPWAAEHRHSSAAQRLAMETHRMAVAEQSAALNRKGKANQVRATAMLRLVQQRGGIDGQGTAMALLSFAWQRQRRAAHCLATE